MKQLVVLSGKGGTGKTCVSAALAHLAAHSPVAGRLVVADTDVDAANLGLVLKPHTLESDEFRGGAVAVIDELACAACGICEEVCRFDAVHVSGSHYVVDPVACDGCAACVYQCPAECITMKEGVAGIFHRSETRYGPLYHANLFAGQENSGKLVNLVKQRARLQAIEENRQLLLADGPPGIGCPVISAASGADFVLIVTEPSVAGMHDMRRTVETVRHFGVPAVMCINKADIYAEGTVQIENFCRECGVEIVGRVPFDEGVPAAMVAGESVTAFLPESPASRAIIEMWNEIARLIEEAS